MGDELAMFVTQNLGKDPTWIQGPSVELVSQSPGMALLERDANPPRWREIGCVSLRLVAGRIQQQELGC